MLYVATVIWQITREHTTRRLENVTCNLIMNNFYILEPIFKIFGTLYVETTGF